MKHLWGFVLFFLCGVFTSRSESFNPVQWKIAWDSVGENEVEIFFTAKIEKGWHIYGMNLPQGGPVSTDFSFHTLKNIKQEKKVSPLSSPIIFYDSIFGMEISTFSNEVSFSAFFERTSKEDFLLEGEIIYMACDGQHCLAPQREKYNMISVHREYDLHENRSYSPYTENMISSQEDKKEERTSLWKLFLLGIMGGIFALITPCVWPMIPLTMGFFLKRNKSRKGAVKEGVVYTLSILLIYVVLGTLLTLVFGADFLNKLSTNAGVNLFFFALLILFGLSFMGLFEVNLPSSWVNFSDRKSGEKKGLFSIFFMAFTLFLVSFSCTAPIVGTLLVELVSSREILAPMIGMLGFALSLAIPFSLLALFPSLLTHLPKSGSGLKDIKFLLGVCEIAFSLKFFSVADGAYRWGILSRKTFLWIWIVLSIFLMVYFLIKTYKNFLQKDSLGALVRFLVSTLFFLLSFHLYNATLGNKLSPEIEAFLPPAKNQIKGTYYDYEEGMKQSKLIHKPVLLNFSGYGCVNCRKMERTILQDPEIREWIEKNFVFIQLYVDDRTSLPSSIQVEWEGKKRTLSTFGEKWSYIQSTQYKMNAQPYFVLLSYEGELLGEPCGFTFSKEEFKKFLVGGLEEMKNRGY